MEHQFLLSIVNVVAQSSYTCARETNIPLFRDCRCYRKFLDQLNLYECFIKENVITFYPLFNKFYENNKNVNLLILIHNRNISSNAIIYLKSIYVTNDKI